MDDRIREEDNETLKPRLSCILNLTLCASVGGLVFGYYVGFIIAQFGMLSDLESILHETVRTGLIGAVLGAAAGGWTNDCLGRKQSILISNVLITVGALPLMLLLSIGDSVLCFNYCLESIGNMFIGFGVGIISITSPLYISEFSPPKLRDILVSLNFILYGFGKFLFLYLYNDSSLSSNFIIALLGITSLSHFYLMLKFPESPMWLYKKERKEEAIKVLNKYYACFEVDKEYDAFKLLIQSETTYQDGFSYSSSSIFSKIRVAWHNPSVRKQFVVGTALHVVQQLVGLNSLIFFNPGVHKLSGFGPSDPKDDIEFKKTSLYISFGVFSIFSGVCCTFGLLQRFGKKKMLCWSTYCVLAVLLGLSFIFMVSPTTGVVNRFESTIYFKNNTCSSYLAAPDADSWDCLTCLRASSGCGFCSDIHKNILVKSIGACLIAESNGKSQACYDENRFWSTESCEDNVFAMSVVFIFSFIVFAGSLEIIPWIMNSQMYPTEVRGVYGGTAAAANWTFFLIAIISSFVLTETHGPVFSCLLISMLSFFISLFIKSFIPENIVS